MTKELTPDPALRRRQRAGSQRSARLHCERFERCERGERGERGSTTVEFAIVGSLLFAVILGIVDFGQLFWTNLTMQYAVREGVRYAVTGQTGLAPTAPNATARCDAAVAKIKEQSMGLYERTTSKTVFKTIASDGSIATLGAGSCYGASQVIVVQVDSAAKAWTPILASLLTNGEYRFSVSTTMKNEAFK